MNHSIAAFSLLLAMLVSVAGTGLASAASGSEQVGGGEWTWETLPGVYASSAYFHRQNMHSASAQVGTGEIKSDVARPNNTARAKAYGVGTTRVWWNNEVE